ncbi:MAG TPA: glycosyltransferase family 2 protein [Vicinamibacterales bacterium]|nr:glycosyltransferase family 2 protein [Vicinamibacterales bacterium]
MTAATPTDEIIFTLVIPAYNEGNNLSSVLDDVLATLVESPKAQPFEVLVVDDGSTDDTGQVADDYARRFRDIRVFHHATNQGLGVGLRTGFSHSRGKFVSWIAADGQVKAEQAVKLLNIAENADFITTRRVAVTVEAGAENRPCLRRILSWCMHILCRACLGAYPSHFTGIYMVRGSYLRSVPLCSRTGLVGMELYFQSLERQVRLAHGEMAVCPRLSGKSKVATPSGIMKSIIGMLKMRCYLQKSRGITLAATGTSAKPTSGAD